MITRTINKILKSLNNLPAEYKVALARILTGMIEGIDYLNKEKVDKEEGKGLSTNDFTDNLKDKLNHIEDGAQKNVKSDWNAIEGDSVILNKPSLLGYPDSAEYDSISHNIIFKHQGTILPQMTISGANFIKDGMVDSITIENNNLIITFNTDAGKQPISIPLTDIFNPNNYYTKTQTDNKFVEKVVGKQLSTEDFTTDLKTKLEHIGPTEQSDWEQNDNTQPNYIKNRTHYKDIVSPVVNYRINNEDFTGSINDILNYLDNNIIPVEAIFISPHYNIIIEQQNPISECFTVGMANDDDIYMFAIYYDSTPIIEYTVQSITNIECKQNFLNLVSLICDNINDVYKFKKVVNFSNVDEFKNYYFNIEDDGYIYNKIDKRYLPDDVHGDWDQNNSNEPNYIENRTHYRERAMPKPIAEYYDSDGHPVEGTVEDLLTYLLNGNNITQLEISLPIYTYIENEQNKEASFYVSTKTDAEAGTTSLLLNESITAATLISFANIASPIELRAKLLEIINLICDNTTDGYKFKKSIVINNITYNVDENKLEYIYHKLDKNYLPDININLIEITYNELKNLKDTYKLIPGMQYRITDYKCVVSSNIINIRSGNHQFDIIVTANTINELNENARACLHKDDTYFANSKLEAWELKYSLDNDINKFNWAAMINGKGVIYWMKDEWGNECPYDFKNIIMVVNNESHYTFSSIDYKYRNNIINKYIVEGIQHINFIFFESYASNNIFGNDCANNVIMFGDNNVFGNACSRNNISGNNNVFGNNCGNNSIIGNNNVFGNKCYNIVAYSNFNFNIIKNNCANLRFYKEYIQNIIVESHNSYITLTSTQTTSVNNVLTNITIAQGTNNSSNRKTISHDTINDNFQTIYKPIGSTEVEI